MRASRIETQVLFLEEGPLRKWMESSGVPAQVIPWSGTRRDGMGAFRVWRWIKSLRPDLVQLHHGGNLVRLVCRWAGVRPLVQHLHSEVVEPDLTPLSTHNLRYADAIIACSRAAAEKLNDARVRVIYAGIDVPAEPPAAPPIGGPLRIGVLGRLVPLKNVDAIIRAAAALRAQSVDVEVEIAGRGPSEPELRQLAADLDPEPYVKFLGWREDTRSLLGQWHLIAMPSSTEGFPVAVLEAMAAGRAVVASRVGGIPEIVEDGVTGLLMDPGNAEQLSVALSRLAHNRLLLESMGRAGWQRVGKNFSIDAMVRDTRALYRELER